MTPHAAAKRTPATALRSLPRCIHAANIDWTNYYGGAPHVELPRICGTGKPSGRRMTSRSPTTSRRTRLGIRESGRFGRKRLTADLHPYIADHGFRGRAVLPGSAHIELMLAAADGSFADPFGINDGTRPHFGQTTRRCADDVRRIDTPADCRGEAHERHGAVANVQPQHHAPSTSRLVTRARMNSPRTTQRAPLSCMRFERAGHYTAFLPPTAVVEAAKSGRKSNLILARAEADQLPSPRRLRAHLAVPRHTGG